MPVEEADDIGRQADITGMAAVVGIKGTSLQVKCDRTVIGFLFSIIDNVVEEAAVVVAVVAAAGVFRLLKRGMCPQMVTLVSKQSLVLSNELLGTNVLHIANCCAQLQFNDGIQGAEVMHIAGYRVQLVFVLANTSCTHGAALLHIVDCGAPLLFAEKSHVGTNVLHAANCCAQMPLGDGN